jgi:hypothetical protein
VLGRVGITFGFDFEFIGGGVNLSYMRDYKADEPVSEVCKPFIHLTIIQ